MVTNSQALTVAQARDELRRAVADLSQRCLHFGSKWAAEQLVGLERAGPPDTGAASSSGRVPAEEDSWLLLGRSLIDCQEYARAADVLRRGRATPVSRFLQRYAEYLRLHRAAAGAPGPRGAPGAAKPRSQHRQGLERLLAGVLADLGFATAEAAAAGDAAGHWGLGAATGGLPSDHGDPFLAYLAGMVLADLGHEALARGALTASVRAYPCMYPAWKALVPLCREQPHVMRAGAPPGSQHPPGLPRHWATDMFLATAANDAQRSAEALAAVRALRASPVAASTTVSLLAATAEYNQRSYDAALQAFETLMDEEPAMLDGVDVYSNILYVHEGVEQLSLLARRAMSIDRYRPESNCVVGNFFSLRGDHTKAVMYFDRAVKLDKNYLSAWTLIGHEFVELKNSAAAIQAYRRAVDINPVDFRAWYGLGQTYEFLLQPHFALYYYKQAVKIRPQDGRMWTAVGTCYQQASIAQTGQAIQAYQRAVELGDPDGVALDRLARLYEETGQMELAARHHRAVLERAGPTGAPHSAFFLAEEATARGDVAEVERLMAPFLDTGGRDRERAKAVLRAARAAQSAGALPQAPVPGVLEDSGSDISLDAGSD